MEETIYEMLDLNKTRMQARKHLRLLGKKVMRDKIMDYMHFTSSIIRYPEHNNNQSNKVLNAMEKMDRDQEQVGEYLKTVVSCINRLEKEQRDALLGKYLYRYDSEEMIRYLKKSMPSIRNLIRDSEVDFALFMGCVVMKEGNKDE